ncbi:MAG TPA: SPFH domain-containing protein [Blastocatellia bacterium]|nr:SPFH domain-containing protein [Blastocatellia bacterium]
MMQHAAIDILAQGGGSFLSPELRTLLMIVFAVVIIVLMLSGILSRYKKIPPDKALILYGGGDFRALTGGAVIVWPVINEAYELDLRAFQLELDLLNAPNKDRIPINMRAMATCKISKEENLLKRAAENFGRSSMDDIQTKVRNVMEGHLRVVVGQINMDTILSERDQFNAKIQSEAAIELQSLGIEVTILNILEVSDDNGVISALGKPMIAKIKAEAMIQEAEQTRRQTIDTTNAQKEGETTRAQNETAIAQALRDKIMKTSEYDAQVARQQATTSQAGPFAEADAKKAVVEAEVAVQRTRTEAEIGLQDAVRRRNEAELQATTITQANAERQRVVIAAEGEATARTTKANAERTALQMEGEGQAQKSKAIGFSQAEVTRQTGLAQAEVIKETGLAGAEVAKETGLANAAAQQALLLANADGTRAEALARAAGVEAELSAQATGRKLMVDAYAGMDEEQRKLFLTTVLLDRLPEIVVALGAAGEKIMQPIAEAVTASLSQIDNMTVYDSGHAANGDGSIKRVMAIGPDVLFNAIQQIKAMGLTPVLEGLLAKAGIDVNALGSFETSAKSNGAEAPGQIEAQSKTAVAPKARDTDPSAEPKGKQLPGA